MHLKNKLIVAASLCIASSSMHAVGEIPNAVAGALFGVGYKKIFQSTSTAAAIPLTALALGAEFLASSFITLKMLNANHIANKKIRGETIGTNLALVYGTSLGSALALSAFENYSKSGSSDAVDTHIQPQQL